MKNRWILISGIALIIIFSVSGFYILKSDIINDWEYVSDVEKISLVGILFTLLSSVLFFLALFQTNKNLSLQITEIINNEKERMTDANRMTALSYLEEFDKVRDKTHERVVKLIKKLAGEFDQELLDFMIEKKRDPGFIRDKVYGTYGILVNKILHGLQPILIINDLLSNDKLTDDIKFRMSYNFEKYDNYYHFSTNINELRNLLIGKFRILKTIDSFPEGIDEYDVYVQIFNKVSHKLLVFKDGYIKKNLTIPENRKY